MKKKITLKDIARELEVSISTVSKALKNSEEISRDTKDKIQAFAKQHNYKPNNIAISLKNRRTHNIGVIIPKIVHHFFTTVVKGIERYATSKGYNVLVCISNESFEKEVAIIELLVNGSVDGFILSLASDTQKRKDYSHLKEVTEQGIPLVLFDRITDEVKCDKVTINDKEGAYLAVKKLIENGRKKIALITTEDYISVSNSRKEGYCQALEEHNILVKENLILRLPSMKIDEDAINDFFKREDIDAVLCVNEILAIYSMRFVQKLSLRIPEDIAFIGFTDGMLSKFSNPTLTTVAQHGGMIGEAAARLLIEKVESDDDDEVAETYTTEILKTTLIERESTWNN
ncbi:MAG: LacI family DNA-binding transcriptional regulator [Cellulophaga sp.]